MTRKRIRNPKRYPRSPRGFAFMWTYGTNAGRRRMSWWRRGKRAW